MNIALLSYETSPLNELLKGIIFLLFLFASCLYYSSWKRYGGILRSVSSLLLISAIAGALGAWFRLNGDFYIQYKWGESLFNIIFGIILLALTLLIRKRFLEALLAFGIKKEGISDD